MKGLFGEDIFIKAQTNQTMLIEQLRKENALGVSRNTGILSSLSSVGAAGIKTNTFFGE